MATLSKVSKPVCGSVAVEEVVVDGVVDVDVATVDVVAVVEFEVDAAVPDPDELALVLELG
jgi:hypothetical protein